jgi:hypothetical protein
MKTAIRDASESLRRFLESALQDDPDLSPYFDPADPSPDAVGTMVVTLDTPQELEGREEEGVSLWLYLVQREEFTLNRPPRRSGVDRVEPRPLPLRLHFLVTPLVNDETRQDATALEHLILGKLLQVLHDESCLSGAALLGNLAGSGLSFFVRLEPLSLEEITRVWDALDRSYQLCVSYEMSIVQIDAAVDALVTPPVTSATSESGVALPLEGV